MRATSKDLRFHTKEILDAAVRGEEVIITFHGKPYAKILPIAKAMQKINKMIFAECGKTEKILAMQSR